MRVYQPQIRISLVKTRARDTVSGTLPASSERYKEPRILDLTPYLSDGGVRLHKGVREPAGAFSISLVPRPYVHDGKPLMETLDRLIEPMDMVEIRMAHEPPGPSLSQAERRDWPPVVMRGFVSQVARSESIANGTPQRSIVVSGHDYGKLWQILQVFYLSNSVVGDNILHDMKFFQKYATADDAKNMSAETFIHLVLDKLLNPYLARMTAPADQKGGMPRFIVAKTNITGTVSPFGPGGAPSGTSVYQLLSRFLDVGAFNELYIEDVGPDVVLVARPQPAWGGDGAAYDPTEVLPESVDIGLGDVVSVQMTRSDAGVYNVFEVESTRATITDQTTHRNLAMEEKSGNPLRMLDQNQEAAFFGVRRLAVNTTLNNPALIMGDSETKEQRPGEAAKTLTWLAARRERLVLLNRDASVFECGSLRLKGNEAIRAGMRLRLRHPGPILVTYYIVAVAHEFIPGAGFFTTVQVERGNGFILSASLYDAPELARRDFGGVK